MLPWEQPRWPIRPRCPDAATAPQTKAPKPAYKHGNLNTFPFCLFFTITTPFPSESSSRLPANPRPLAAVSQGLAPDSLLCSPSRPRGPPGGAPDARAPRPGRPSRPPGRDSRHPARYPDSPARTAEVQARPAPSAEPTPLRARGEAQAQC